MAADPSAQTVRDAINPPPRPSRDRPASSLILRQQTRLRQTDGFEGLLSPLLDVVSCVPLRLIGDQTDERLLYDPRLGDAVRTTPMTTTTA